MNNIITQYKMINCHDIAKENIKEHNLNWRQISDLSYRIYMKQNINC